MPICKPSRTPRPQRSILMGIGILMVALLACRSKSRREEPGANPSSAAAPEPANLVEVNFVYGSEKKAWLSDAIKAFNRSPAASSAEMTVRVNGIASGSGAIVDEIVEGITKPDAWSPASDIFRPMLNDAWTKKHGAISGKVVAPEGKSLALSPVVIAIWKPMAKALGWPDKAIGWSDILELSKNPKGWASIGHSEWGLFKLGHTHPEHSNSGLMAVLAEAYAAVGKTRDLTAADLASPKTLGFLEDIEGSIVHYGKSTGFFAEKMLARGPRFLSAAVLYENLVVDAYVQPEFKDRELDLVAIYPKEGTFWIDNPYIVLDAPWVSAKKKRAAERFRDYLLSKAVQTEALTRYGFRPADPGIPTTAPLDAAHGVDPKQPKTLLAAPDPELVRKLLEAWRKTKKTVDLEFVFDRSGSMRGEPLRNAKQGAREFVGLLDGRDRVATVFFNHLVPAVAEPRSVAEARQELLDAIDGTFAEGGTALYDAISVSHQKLEASAREQPKRMHALVVLSDGRDESSKGSLHQLITRISPSAETATAVRIFTVAYGSGADPAVLAQVAEASGGAPFKGDERSIRQIYQDLAAFF
jgi:Ca-activated chloride channel homolog